MDRLESPITSSTSDHEQPSRQYLFSPLHLPAGLRKPYHSDKLGVGRILAVAYLPARSGFHQAFTLIERAAARGPCVHRWGSPPRPWGHQACLALPPLQEIEHLMGQVAVEGARGRTDAGREAACRGEAVENLPNLVPFAIDEGTLGRDGG